VLACCKGSYFVSVRELGLEAPAAAAELEDRDTERDREQRWRLLPSFLPSFLQFALFCCRRSIVEVEIC
jgi:hypothetical protein